MEKALKAFDEKLEEKLIEDMISDIDNWFGHTHTEHLAYYFVSEMKKEVEPLSKERFKFWDKIHQRLSARIISFGEFAKKNNKELSPKSYKLFTHSGLKDEPISAYNDDDMLRFRNFGKKNLEVFKRLRGY